MEKRPARRRLEVTDLETPPLRELRKLVGPLRSLLSPVVIGAEHVPRAGAVLIVGNHTIFGLLDIPMLGLELYERTGRLVRGLGDHAHFALPLWRDLLHALGGVRGTRENCARLFEQGEAVLVYPGGGREVMKHKHEKYQLIWKERVGFASLAIRYGVPIVPLAAVGVEDMFEILVDAEEILRSPIGKLLRVLGVTKQPWFRHGEVLPPITRGAGPAGLVRLERQYFLLGPPIDTKPFTGRHEHPDACFELRRQVKAAVEGQIQDLLEVQAADPERYPIQRLLRRLAARLG